MSARWYRFWDRWYRFWSWLLPRKFKCKVLGWHRVTFADPPIHCSYCTKVW